MADEENVNKSYLILTMDSIIFSRKVPQHNIFQTKQYFLVTLSIDIIFQIVNKKR